MRGTVLVCAVGVICTLGYLGISHRNETKHLAEQLVYDMNMIKTMIMNRLKHKDGAQIENTLSGDLKNIEKKMQKIEHTKKADTAESARLSSVDMKSNANAELQTYPSMLSNSLVDSIIESYLAQSIENTKNIENTIQKTKKKKHNKTAKKHILDGIKAHKNLQKQLTSCVIHSKAIETDADEESKGQSGVCAINKAKKQKDDANKINGVSAHTKLVQEQEVQTEQSATSVLDQEAKETKTNDDEEIRADNNKEENELQ